MTQETNKLTKHLPYEMSNLQPTFIFTKTSRTTTNQRRTQLNVLPVIYLQNIVNIPSIGKGTDIEEKD